MAISFKGAHFPPDIILMGVRWYVAYPLSYRHVEELLEARGVPIDHATIQRWVGKYIPLLEEAFHRRKRPVWVSWRMDETSIKIKGQWYYLYRAVDKTGQTIDCPCVRFKPPPSGGQISSPLFWTAYNSPPPTATGEELWTIATAVI